MIGWLQGRVVAVVEPNDVIVDVHGVGYRLTVPPGDSAAARLDEVIELHVHTYVREDAIVLYGFTQAEARRCFEALLGAHGVGPSLAIAILSALSPEALATAVRNEEVDTLCLVPGIGKKTAARLLLELSTRLDVPTVPRGTSERGSTGGTPQAARSEARAALSELGYGPDEIAGVLQGSDDEATVEDLVRGALRELARSR